ncbi:MAG: HD family phosphohydrolase [Bdellovibrionales bacterium CG10_big_fil_rev_8_21_14_0_10_45_34]|nr:MAG: HD family phosphohydrolase [Bdellovibrionales bacterium CG10_big_fil_rev_8_21_14_0_10_45_34]
MGDSSKLGKYESPKSPWRRGGVVYRFKKFLSWIDSLGLEKSFVGRGLLKLEDRFKIRRIVLLFVYGLVLAFISNLDLDFFYTGYSEGDIAATDIKSPIGLDYIDYAQTENKRLEQERAVPPVMDFDRELYEGLINGIYAGFREMRKLIRQEGIPAKGIGRDEKIKEFIQHRSRFDTLLGAGSIQNRDFEWLVEKNFSVAIENFILRVLEARAGLYLTSDLAALNAMTDEKIVLRVVRQGGGGNELPVRITELSDVSEARKLNEKNAGRADRLGADAKLHLQRIVDALVIANVTLNRQETLDRKQKARDSVRPLKTSIAKNQTILTSGSVVQPSHIEILNEIERKQKEKVDDFNSLVLSLIFVVVVLVFASYLRRFTLNKVKIPNKDLTAMGVATLAVLIASKISYFLVNESLGERFSGLIPQMAYIYLLPFAAAPMLVGLIISFGEVVWLFTLFASIVFGLSFDGDATILLVTAVGGIAAARGVYGCKKRNDIYFAGLRTGVVNASVITLLMLLTSSTSEWGRDILWCALAGLISGVFSSFVAMTLVPLFESLFNYTTDVKLLELGNLDHPLMKEMLVKAPGTYHHSLVVGSMVEAAAERIGANPLLAKVASYYHDIGKLKHPQYFIENQRPGHNPHDHLSPHMSKTVLIAHVKDGVEMAKRYKLGKPIVDVILQHHGTTLISYFYNRALERAEVSLSDPDEGDFRYPGPKPQFREAALCMLADSIEAAARSLDEPTPVRLRNIVKNIINRKFLDGQLDECNLTLRDLSSIESAFTKVILGIYHQRIDYPKHAGGGASEPSPTRPKIVSVRNH